MSLFKRIFFLMSMLSMSIDAIPQFQYRFNHEVPVVEGSKTLDMAWAGGLNTGQYNVIDINNDGIDDLMIFNRDNNKVFTFLSDGSKFTYAPEFEHLFPKGLEHWVLLRDYNCDGKADIFTSSIFGMSLYENISSPGGQLAWEMVYETIFTEGASGQVNLQVSSLDLPGIQDIDGDGDLDILVFNFAIGGGVHLHRNMSVETTGKCGLDLFSVTERYGDFEECTCDQYIFGTELCNPGGRLQHSGGKSIVSYPYSGVMAQDLVIGQEACTNTGFLQNMGSVSVPQMTTVDFNFPDASNPVTLNYPALFNLDVNFDGMEDLLATNSIFDTYTANNYRKNNWYYKKTGAGYKLETQAFLQEEMIDVGYAASPALADINNDGDEDLFIGSGNQGGGAKLIYYENDGDALNPHLIIKDNDYLQLSVSGFDRISPQFLDLNRNNQPDLILMQIVDGRQEAVVYWHTNNPLIPYATSNTLKLALPQMAAFDSPFFYFSNSRLALLIGRATGKLSQYINQGSLENPQWELVTDTFLGIADDFRARNINITIADMDGDGKEDLLRYDDSGVLRIYADYRGAATEITQLMQDQQTLAGYNSGFGIGSKVSTTHLTGSKLTSIVLGLKSGGVQLLSNIDDDQQEVAVEIKISLFPNPVERNNLLNLVSNQDVEIEFFDIMGNALANRISLAKGVRQQVDINSLRAGLYLLTAYNDTGKRSTVKFVVAR
jgi:Secretion system C-terminal sorting domain/FG-GAP-like repeat